VSQPSPKSSGNPAQVYEDYMVRHQFRPWAAELLDRAKPQPGERVLDVACGTGIVARMVAQQMKGQVHITGLDLSPAMVEVARSTAAQEGSTIEWHVGSADSLPFSDSSFDLVVIQQGLQFFPDHAAALREVFRVLVPGGRVTSATWTEIDNHPFFIAFAEAVERHFGTSAMYTPFALGDRKKLHALFIDTGFGEIAIERVGRSLRYPSPELFINLGVASTSAAVPALQAMDATQRAMLIQAVHADMAAPLEERVEGEEVVMRMEAHILVARKSG
jgi:ubiquinone/menaquinone biosynthesis C-methylase UbiE